MLLLLGNLGNISRRKMRAISFLLDPAAAKTLVLRCPGAPHRRYSADEWHQKRVRRRAFHGFAAVRQLP